MQKPADSLKVTEWTAYVIAGKDRNDRNARLDEVPEILRAAVRRKVVWYFQRTLRTP